MQTFARKGAARKEKEVAGHDPDHMGGGSTLVMFVVFGVLYMGLVHIMSGFTFDTVFIAIYMTVLSVFILRAFIAGFSHRA
jgi:hypothetical protein